MGAAIIAAVSVLAGTLTAGLMQHVTTSRREKAERVERRRQQLAEAVPALLAAIVRHREHQWLKIAARREGVRDAEDARAKRYAARSAVTSAMDALHMATQDRALLAAAQEAVNAAMALGDAPEDEVDAAGQRAREAHTALREAGAKAVS